MSATFDAFFATATTPPGEAPRTPYAYQRRLAGDTPGRACEPQLINIPTGLGKTAAVVLAWLWNRVAHPDSAHRDTWPRRLVYCLPMRTLVEQTRDETRNWINKLSEASLIPADRKPHIVVLMGGESLEGDDKDWDIYPEANAILIGTQDMLLSRALNRGYGMARARWPMHFGLLNNDCLWVLDETQLMDVGLATSAQLQAYRLADHEANKTLRPCMTWWTSATLRADWIDTVDTHTMVEPLRSAIVEIPPEERQGGIWAITKPCEVVQISDEKKWAAHVWAAHEQSEPGEHGRITLVIVNTVRTACKLHSAVQTVLKKNKATVELRLIHSRFRPRERIAWKDAFLSRATCTPTADRIIIATQIVEAGVDISATTLFTELAPWPSLAQRFGRAARYGGSARVFVVDRSPTEKSALPYGLDELIEARAALSLLPDASLSGLSSFEAANPDTFARLFPYSPLHLLLRRELVELFDTTPDLSGADLDISRFIRSGEERDLLVFWRDIPAKSTPPAGIVATREELCPVPIGDARKWILQGSAKARAWVWDYLDGCWRKAAPDDIYPGQTLLIAKAAGGYHVDYGWTGDAGHRDFATEPNIVVGKQKKADADAASDEASEGTWQTILQHSSDVATAANAIAKSTALPDRLAQLFDLAARWHDLGKAHPAFQSSIRVDASKHPGSSDVAKAPSSAWRERRDLYRLPDGTRRSAFRHELASVLALFDVLIRHQPAHPALLEPHRELLTLLGQSIPEASASAPPTPLEREILALDEHAFNLLAYIVCTHHGKVRTAWHTTPADQGYHDHDGRGIPLHGVREGDRLNPVNLAAADGQHVPQIIGPLTLEPARLGLSPHTGTSWAERIESLLLRHGPFGLAYFEALFRAADARASASPSTSSH